MNAAASLLTPEVASRRAAPGVVAMELFMIFQHRRRPNLTATTDAPSVGKSVEARLALTNTLRPSTPRVAGEKEEGMG